MITHIVIKIKNKNGILVNYLEPGDYLHANEIRKIQHKCRIKEVIYGEVFTYYDIDMDFSNSLKSGSEIIIDNRNK